MAAEPPSCEEKVNANSTWEKIGFETNADVSLLVSCFKNVKNIEELKEYAFSDSSPLSISLIDCENIFSYQHFLVASNLAVHNYKEDVMKTRNVHTELIYSLSPSKNVADSLRRIGAQDSTQHLIIAAFDQEIDELNSFCEKVQGENVGTSSMGRELSSDQVQKFKKSFKIADQELEVSTLEDGIIQKIVTKHFI
mmetsp:Transcript_955/g.1708  ORF Transcript_955/g.1708 Transcript_955/m.1708 type:complete len:195 (+) Transcript_955:23-607(+)